MVTTQGQRIGLVGSLPIGKIFFDGFLTAFDVKFLDYDFYI